VAATNSAKEGGNAGGDALICPECGRTFQRPAGLGAHRRTVHGVVGAKRTRQAIAKRATRKTGTSARRTGGGSSANRPRSTQQSAERRLRTSPRSNADGAPKVDRDRLLKTLFPNGLPAREETLRAATAWLDEAERLARTR
jgi:hypothetical protein